jgi:hypothetical protein
MLKPIEWHERVLEDGRKQCAAAWEYAEKAITTAWRMQAYYDFLERQIKEAKWRGQERFDADKLLRRKKPHQGGWR